MSAAHGMEFVSLTFGKSAMAQPLLRSLIPIQMAYGVSEGESARKESAVALGKKAGSL